MRNLAKADRVKVRRAIRYSLLVMTLLATGYLNQVAHAAAVYQYSVQEGGRRVYLWVPPACTRVRGLIVAFKNLTEQRWLEDPIVRSAAADECLGVVWIGEGKHSDLNADMGPKAGEAFLKMQRDLARESGFPEIANAPVIATGHSAHGQFAWKFAQWAPQRTIAAIAIKTVPLPEQLNLNGVPLLYIVGQTTEWPEFRDGRLGYRDFFWPVVRRSALALRKQHATARIAVAVDPGGGHFDWNEKLARLLALYIRKACAARLPQQASLNTSDSPLALHPAPFDEGWLLDSGGMRPDQFAPAPVSRYKGEASSAYWVFDRAIARAIEHMQGDRKERKKQMLSFEQDGRALPVAASGFASLKVEPQRDGITFQLHPCFLSHIPSQLVGHGQPLGHAEEAIRLSVTTGPVQQTGPRTFQFVLSREAGQYGWLEEEAAQTRVYRKAVQPARVQLAEVMHGDLQQIHFAPIHGQSKSVGTIALHATSSAGLPVRFYVVSGPVKVLGDHLKIVDFPKGGASSIRVIVVAYQLGREAESGKTAMQAAAQVEQRFVISR